MSLPSLPDRSSVEPSAVYGEPLVTDDGATVLPVSRVRRGVATPAGVFVIRDGRATWTPAIDSERIALLGVTTGLVAATLGCLAVLRRPPWPDVTLTVSKTR